MEKKESDYTPYDRVNSEIKSNDPFFSNDTLLNTTSNSHMEQEKYRVELKRHLILETIKKYPARTIYFYAKQTKTNYSQMHEIIKGLVFLRLVAVKQGFDSNGIAQEVFFIPEEEQNEKS